MTRPGVIGTMAIGVGLALGGCANPPDRVEAVRAGLLLEARASWWGFDPTNSTRCLQAAIDSGVPRLIVDNLRRPWIVDPIVLASNQELVFADGVCVLARPGGFHGRGDSLFTADRKTNLVLRGEGQAVLRMNKADYQDPSRYAPAEHRMVIALRAVRDVRIVNLTLQSSGGDGIYVGGYGTNGYCENVLIDRVVCDDHHRLGMAVISAANLTVRDSVFKNTRGTNPNSGVDMEPNYPGERLSGIRFENCVFENNTLAGLYISCGLNGEAEPVGITARHCVFRGNANGLNIAFHSKTTPPRGSVEFLDCEFYGNGAGISLNDPAAEGASVAFIRCTLSADTASCPFAVMGAARERIGNLHVSDLVVRTPAGCRSPVSFGSAPGAALTNITGRLLWDRGGQTSVLDLAELIRSSAWAPYTPAALDAGALRPNAKGSPVERPIRVRTRAPFRFLQALDAGRTATLAFDMVPVWTWKGVKKVPVRVMVTGPDGAALDAFEATPENGPRHTYRLAAGPAGIYRLDADVDPWMAVAVSSDTPGHGYWVYDKLAMSTPSGTLYFQVPAGVREVSLAVSGGGGLETVDAALLDAGGQTADEALMIIGTARLAAVRPAGALSEIWSLRLSHAVDDVLLQLHQDLNPVVSDSPANLLVLP